MDRTREEIQVKRIAFAAMGLAVSAMSVAAPPSENMVKSCLLAHAATPSVTIRSLDTNDIATADNYANGFDALYLFEYRGTDAGYAESKADQALVYAGKIYRLSRSIPVGDSHGIPPGAFNAALAQWGIAKERQQSYFCVSFNFDGIGRSGRFQNVRGGYLLDEKTRYLYFAVRNTKN